jgi:hypothetical protein
MQTGHFLESFCGYSPTVSITGVAKGYKVHPRRGLYGPEGVSRCTISLTWALDGMGGRRHAPAALPPEKETRYPLFRRLDRPRAGMDGYEKSGPSPGFDPRTVQSVASRYSE